MNILKMLFKRSPMNFYYISKGETIIKSINNTSLGYKFFKSFTPEDVNAVWDYIRLYKRSSTILIFLLSILMLYEIVFPHFPLMVNNAWYVNAIIMLLIVVITCQIITKFCTFLFERKLKIRFGEFERSIFKYSDVIDRNYYKIFKHELLKAFVVLLLILSSLIFFSPFKTSCKLIENQKYREAIKLTTFGAKIFPIAQEWYSLRGYAKFQIGDYTGAIVDYDKAYRLCPEGFNIMNFDNKIFIKYFLEDYDSALKDFDNEIANAVDDNEKDQFQWDKAQFLYHIKHYDDALVLYTTLIDKAENDRVYLLKDRLYAERAQVYKALGNYELAKADILNSGLDEDTDSSIPKPTLIFNQF